MSDSTKLPDTKAASDYTYAVAKATLGSTPLVGHALSVALETAFAPPLERRKERWLNALAEVVASLQTRMDGMTPEQLLKDERFISAALQAGQISLRTHQQEKIDMLKAAVASSVTGDGGNDDQHAMFLRFVDELTPSHIRVLNFMRDPARFAIEIQRNTRSTMEAVRIVFPEFLGNRAFVEQIFRDLEIRGLTTELDPLKEQMGSHPPEPKTTKFGVAFLEFVGIRWDAAKYGTAPKAPDPAPSRCY